MKLPKIKNCPVCAQEVNPDGLNAGGVSCDSCGFFAVAGEVM